MPLITRAASSVKTCQTTYQANTHYQSATLDHSLKINRGGNDSTKAVVSSVFQEVIAHLHQISRHGILLTKGRNGTLVNIKVIDVSETQNMHI